jgi:hypothetical protein
MAVMLTEVPEGAMRTFSEEVSPGVIFSYAETPEGCVLTAIEVESGPDRDLSRVEFESLREMPQDA